MYDAIVVGARCAGAPTAMLLARAGHRVLLVDRATFPSDIMSTHYIHQPGVARLKRWGLLDAVLATNCPPIERVRLDAGSLALEGAPVPYEDTAIALCPRRIGLDKSDTGCGEFAYARRHRNRALSDDDRGRGFPEWECRAGRNRSNFLSRHVGHSRAVDMAADSRSCNQLLRYCRRWRCDVRPAGRHRE